MLKIRYIEINNFACFEHIEIEPSTDPERPLTVLRAENGSGKTTFLRALRWGMYGEQGLPSDGAKFSVHPAWWHPDDTGIKTQVTIEFENDGSTRHDTRDSSNSTLYRLARSVTTIGKPTARADEPDFRRVHERTLLMSKKDNGPWERNEKSADWVIGELLPSDLRDFFVMDADEAADFVGGSENKTMSRQAVIRKTTSAVHSLLGIDVFQEASKRVDKIAQGFGAQATKVIGDTNLDELQTELNQLREDQEELNEKISDQRTQKAELEDRLRSRRDDLEDELKNVGAAEELRERLQQNRQLTDKTTTQRATTLGLLAGQLESTELLASLAKHQVSAAYEILRPLHEQGRIPLKHIHYVRSILETGTCVCGQDLTMQGTHRRHVEELITQSAEQENRANYLGQLHDAAKSLANISEETAWDDRSNHYAADFANLDKALSELKLERDDIDKKLSALDEVKIQTIRDEIAALEKQVDNLNRSVATNENTLPSLLRDIDSHEKKIHQRQRGERVAADKRAAENLAYLISKILKRAYATIQGEQVNELSSRMDRLFAQIAANVSDEDLERIQTDKATLKMIAEVGIRPVETKAGEFEIYALNSRSRSMPPIEINGASRRVLALSFVLALCIESKTHAPLIADSLLNFMSGTVRRNTLRATAENSSQPILMLTGSDLAAPSEVETVQKHAGATYTLTGQWDAIDAGGGGDVVHWTEQRQVSLVCECGPREYCKVCERVGWDDSPGWNKRD